MIVGASLWAYIIGNAVSVLSQFDVHNVRHRQTMDLLNLFMQASRHRIEWHRVIYIMLCNVT